MSEERNDKQPTPKRITFDDYQIGGGGSDSSSDADSSERGSFLKKAVPRIKNFSGDLLIQQS